VTKLGRSVRARKSIYAASDRKDEDHVDARNGIKTRNAGEGRNGGVLLEGGEDGD
jgi:hypothetical protein